MTSRPALMDLFVRDLPQLRAGPWWRAAMPVPVQSDGGWQLGFNMFGLAVVGAALERRVSRTCWALAYLVGGSAASPVGAPCIGFAAYRLANRG
jgi:membrane associated rhomboid family serine protease